MDKKEKLIDWINQKWKGQKTCPVCGENSWGVFDNLWELREFTEGNLRLGGPIMPLAALACKHCGYVMTFNALTIGLIEPDKPSENKSNIPDSQKQK